MCENGELMQKAPQKDGGTAFLFSSSGERMGIFFLSAYAWGASPAQAAVAPIFSKMRKWGKESFLRGRLPYARENKIITSRLTLKRNANVASLPLLFLMRKVRTHKTKGFRLARIYPLFWCASTLG